MKRSIIIVLYKIAYYLNRWRRMLFRPLTIGVKVILIRDDQVLLVRHTYQPGWFLPGGGVKRSEALEAAARREAWEELGATLDEVTLLGVYSHVHTYKNEHIAVFVSHGFSLIEKADYEIAELTFFPLTELPPGIDKGSYLRIEEYRQQLPANEARMW